MGVGVGGDVFTVRCACACACVRVHVSGGHSNAPTGARSHTRDPRQTAYEKGVRMRIRIHMRTGTHARTHTRVPCIMANTCTDIATTARCAWDVGDPWGRLETGRGVPVVI